MRQGTSSGVVQLCCQLIGQLTEWAGLGRTPWVWGIGHGCTSLVEVGWLCGLWWRIIQWWWRGPYWSLSNIIVDDHDNDYCPWQAFFEDLAKEVEAWKGAGDQVVILVDINVENTFKHYDGCRVS